MNAPVCVFDPERDLRLERVVELSPELIWAAWTEPHHLMHWFCPLPWQTVECEIDLRPGGMFRTVMRSPEGEDHPNAGCFLEIIPNRRLVWTDALGPGYRPASQPFMTGVIQLERRGEATLYTAIAKHSDEATMAKHREMGFEVGWGIALDQLIAHMNAQ